MFCQFIKEWDFLVNGVSAYFLFLFFSTNHFSAAIEFHFKFSHVKPMLFFDGLGVNLQLKLLS